MKKPPQNIIVTGAAGFIGFHLASRLAREFSGFTIHGIDNINSYYDPSLKQRRLSLLNNFANFKFYKADISNAEAISTLFKACKPDIVLHMAAQAGVRYSLENPQAYIDSNVTGLLNVLEGCRKNEVRHLIYASSSSVYGANTKTPFATTDPVDHPVSLYAATKRAGELMAHTYAHLYRIPCTGLRFFTVYGPWGRPDMAYYKFTQKILAGDPIEIYNNGDMERDFTYIDDIIEGIVGLIPHPPIPSDATAGAPAKVYNIGNNKPEKLGDLVTLLELELKRTAKKIYLPMQAGDVYATFADIDDLSALTGFTPKTPLKVGLKKFVEWYRGFNQ
ncbi:MAG: NAD-dependent epimerase [Pseudobdellovibrionaceae bacterium]